MLFLCHDFYKELAVFNVNVASLSRLASSNARRLWDYMKTEGLKQGGVKKIGEKIETETEKLNREAREAIKNSTAVITHKKLGEDKIKDGCLKIDEGILLLERLGGTQKVWEYLISDAGKRQKVLGLRKKLNQPLELRRLSKDIPVPLEPELYIAELHKVEVALRAGGEEDNKIGHIQPIAENNLFIFLDEDFKDLNNNFREDFIEAIQVFSQEIIKSNRPWKPIIITDAEKRSIEKQAQVMEPHFGKTADIYAPINKEDLSKPKTEKRKILEMLDGLMTKNITTLNIDLTYVQKISPPFSMTQNQYKETLAFSQHLHKAMFGGITSDEFIQKQFFRIACGIQIGDRKKAELAKELLRYMMETNKYGYFSRHRLAKAIDVSAKYYYLKDLKKYLGVYKKKDRVIFALSTTESYDHLHISYLL